MLEDNGENKNLDKAKEEIAAENPAENSILDAPAKLIEPENEAVEASGTVDNVVAEHAAEPDSEQYSETSNEPSTEEVAESADEMPNDGIEETVSEAVATEKPVFEEAAIEADTATDGVVKTEDAEDPTQAAAPETEATAEAADVDEPVRFQELALPGPLVAAVDELGFEFCTPIQGRSLPFSLSDYDVTGQAQTGTGKTAAFLITLFTRFWENPLQTEQASGTPRALVLAPTRELAMQIEGDAQSLSKHMGMRTVCVVGGMDYGKQREELEEGPVDVLVATPGRLIDFVERREINLREVEVLVIDEADRMLDMGFIPDVRRIVLQTPHKRKRQTLFFSATFNDAVMRLAQSWTIDAEHIIVEPESVATDTVDQKFWLVGARERQKVLFQFLTQAHYC